MKLLKTAYINEGTLENGRIVLFSKLKKNTNYKLVFSGGYETKFNTSTKSGNNSLLNTPLGYDALLELGEDVSFTFNSPDDSDIEKIEETVDLYMV